MERRVRLVALVSQSWDEGNRGRHQFKLIRPGICGPVTSLAHLAAHVS